MTLTIEVRRVNEYLKAAVDGFMQGAKETPRGFIAPLIALVRWMDRVTGDGMAESKCRESHDRTTDLLR